MWVFNTTVSRHIEEERAGRTISIQVMGKCLTMGVIYRYTTSHEVIFLTKVGFLNTFCLCDMNLGEERSELNCFV